MSNASFSQLEKKVFELLEKNIAPQLFYHNETHTRDVLQQAQVIAAAENITDEKELLLLKTAALFHDTGFTKAYMGHEPVSCEIARNMLAETYSEVDIDEICRLIMTTAVPQKPYNTLSAILCDADLDYLGRDDFFTISNRLKQEWLNYGIIDSEAAFHEKQIQFLEAHEYFTEYSRKHRKPVEQQHLVQLCNESDKG